MTQQPIVVLSGRCTTCGERVECRLGGNADRCTCGAVLLDLTMLGWAWRQTGRADAWQPLYGRPMTEAPRDGTVIHGWTYPGLQEILVQWDEDRWQCVGKDEPRWLCDTSLLCWVPHDEK